MFDLGFWDDSAPTIYFNILMSVIFFKYPFFLSSFMAVQLEESNELISIFIFLVRWIDFLLSIGLIVQNKCDIFLDFKIGRKKYIYINKCLWLACIKGFSSLMLSLLRVLFFFLHYHHQISILVYTFQFGCCC